VDRFAIYYQNFGANTANDVHVKFTLPANSLFYRAEFFAIDGLIPKKFPAGSLAKNKKSSLRIGCSIF
jgi:hypothetical protein